MQDANKRNPVCGLDAHMLHVPASLCIYSVLSILCLMSEMNYKNS
jgi:hypothetical protein